MNTEITEDMEVRGWICYDADCPSCVRLAQRFCGVFTRRGYPFVPLQAPWVRNRLHLSDADLLTEMRVLLPDGTIIGGADAIVHLARRVWWGWPLCAIQSLPHVPLLCRRLYRWIAVHRYCGDALCPVARRHGRARHCLERLPAILLPAAVAPLAVARPGWVCMWTIAAVLFLAAKWITAQAAVLRAPRPSQSRVLAYFFLWPGMDAVAFLRHRAPGRPLRPEWLMAAAKTLLGAVLLWTCVRRVPNAWPLLKGWLGMVGIVLLLHFGSFHLVSLLCRTMGIDAKPIMRWPITAVSLTQFWGGRWNNAFSDLMHSQVLVPMRKRLSLRRVTLLVFLISGLLHELVISLPARGGYGLPTLYFLVQACGLLAERSRLGRRLRLGRGLRGWLFTMIVTASPAFWLFPPNFMHHVILPMLRAIGAT